MDNQEAALGEDLMVEGETYGCVTSFCLSRRHLMEMEQILLLQLESEMDG